MSKSLVSTEPIQNSGRVSEPTDQGGGGWLTIQGKAIINHCILIDGYNESEMSLVVWKYYCTTIYYLVYIDTIDKHTTEYIVAQSDGFWHVAEIHI